MKFCDEELIITLTDWINGKEEELKDLKKKSAGKWFFNKYVLKYKRLNRYIKEAQELIDDAEFEILD